MKIIKKGICEKKVKVAYKECKECDKCGCEFEFDAADINIAGSILNEIDFIKCPWCGEMIMLNH